MLESLEKIFATRTIQDTGGMHIPLHSNTSMEQGIFLQKMFDLVKPKRSLEVGFAYGISTLFILEKHRENNSEDEAHIVIEPDDYWGTAAVHNITQEGLLRYLQIRKNYSDKILTQLFHENYRIQYAYIDTTKQFDVVMQDFYFINKLMDIGGVIILDDCGGGWPGIQRVARFINTLPHYKKLEGHIELKYSVKKKMAKYFVSSIIRMLPFKKKLYETIDFKTDKELGINYCCIAFQKISEDIRNWDWDRTF